MTELYAEDTCRDGGRLQEGAVVSKETSRSVKASKRRHEVKRIGMDSCIGKLGSEEGIQERPKPTIKPDLYWQQFKTSCCASPMLPKPSKTWGNSHPASALPGQRCFRAFW